RIDAALAAEQLARATATQAAATHTSLKETPAAAAPVDATPAATASDTSALAPVSSLPTTSATPNLAASVSRFPRSKTLFATAASIAALALLIGRPWIHPTDTVTATGPTTSASDSTPQQRAVSAAPRETLVQVSRHSYHRSSLAQDALAFMSGQGSGNAVNASAAPKEWQPVTECVKRTLSVLGASLTSKVDLGWLDGKPSAIVVISDTMATNPATQVRVLQETKGKCSIAASTALTP
ncbi:MAG: hypothetical protein EBU85_04715, partial [Actinobacteria bacterium]|nr:hypothetical protein [Actinomycetota bacterium]